MPLVQGIDSGALLDMFRKGRSDGAAARKAQAEAEHAKELKGLMGQVFGGEQQGGVTGQFASPSPTTNMAPQGGLEQVFDAAIPGAAPAAPMGAPAAPRMPTQGAPRFNPQALAKLIAFDPETGGKIVSAFKTLDETDLKRQQTKNDIMGSAASYAQQGKTEQERQARFQNAVPQLMAAGWTPQEIEQIGGDLSDESLGGYQALAIEYDKKIDNELAERAHRLNVRKQELAEREFEAGKTVPVTAGGNVAIVKPDGTAKWAIGGGPQSEAAPANIARPQSKADFDALPPGATFVAPDGTTRTKPGGPTQPASGGFPSGQ